MNSLNLHGKLNNAEQLQIIEQEVGDISPLLAMYPEEALGKLIENKDKLRKIALMFNSDIMSVTSTAIVMKCNVLTCPYKTSCPLYKNDIAPEGYTCPIEKKISSELQISLIRTLDIDTQDTVEMEMLFDFIEAKLLDLRTSGMLGETSLVQTITKEGGRSGSIMSKDVSPEFTIKMDLKSLKTKILNEFMATRLSKKKYGIQGSSTVEDIIRSAMSK
jgi:hypothetical protein